MSLRQLSTSARSRLAAHCIRHSSGPGRMTIDKFCDIDEVNGFFRSFRRAGGPCLCSLPRFSTGVFPSLQGETHEKIISKTGEILHAEGIRYSSIAATGRRSAIKPEPHPIPTVEIIVQERALTDTEKDWREVTRKIYHSIVEAFPGKKFC